MFALQCALISFCAIFASPNAPWGGHTMKYLFERPIVGGLICGIILGDVTTGVLAGCAIQLVYIGYFQVGGIGAMDMGIIAWPCVALAIISNLETTAAIALATGLSTVFASLNVLIRNLVCVAAGSVMRRGIETGNEKEIFIGYWLIPVIMYTLMRGVTTFILLYFGSGAIERLVSVFPPVLMTALNAVGAWLPAIGIATLLVYLAGDIWGVIFFICGFAAFGYLGLNSLSILMFAIAFAYLYYRTMNTGGSTLANAASIDDEEVL